MTQFAVVNLQTLNFTRASSGTGNSKPYIWPAVVWIDSAGVNVTSPPVQIARVLIANGMHAGDTADIPRSVGQLIAPIGDNFGGLIIVVALWDQRDTPDDVVQSGFQTFSSELRAAIQDNLAGLLDPNQRNATVNAVQKRVNDKISATIESALSFLQKIEIFLGQLHLDTNVGSDHTFFQQLIPSSVALDIVQPVGTAANEYKIAGNLEVFATEISFPPSLGFGKLAVGQVSNPAQLKIANLGTAVATVSIPPSPHVHANFTWDPSGSHTISPGASFALQVTCNCLKLGPNDGQLEFSSNAVGSPHTVDLSCTGVQGHPQ